MKKYYIIKENGYQKHKALVLDTQGEGWLWILKELLRSPPISKGALEAIRVLDDIDTESLASYEVVDKWVDSAGHHVDSLGNPIA